MKKCYTKFDIAPPTAWLQMKSGLIMMMAIVFGAQVLAAEQEKTAVDVLVENNTAFALDLYKHLSATNGNIFFSPYSISVALGMTYAGARGETEKQMAKTLGVSQLQQELHPAFAELRATMNNSVNAAIKTGYVSLNIANSLWPDKAYKFQDDYVSLIEKNYGASITPLDFVKEPEMARKTINGWVEKKTHDRVKELIQPGVINDQTRLILANAIYFKGFWSKRFKPENTGNAPFYVSTNISAEVSLMRQVATLNHALLEGLQVLELPYKGNALSMLILLPKERDGLKKIEADLSIQNINQYKRQLRSEEVQVLLPRFKMTSIFRLDAVLTHMGMVDAFDSKADFSGMDGSHNLSIGAVVHKAFVEVNEDGTEAAAATMGGYTPFSAPPEFRVDHPFIILIQERKTGSILFIGRVEDPTKQVD